MFKYLIVLLISCNLIFSAPAYAFAQSSSQSNAEEAARLISSVQNAEPHSNGRMAVAVSGVGALSVIYALKKWTDFMEKKGYKYAAGGAPGKELQYMIERGYVNISKEGVSSLNFKLSEIIRKYISIKFSGLKLSTSQTDALMTDIYKTFQQKGINLYPHINEVDGKIVQSYSFMVPEQVEKRANIFAKNRYRSALKARNIKAGLASLAVLAVCTAIYFALPDGASDNTEINMTRIRLQRAIYKIKAEDPSLFTLYICSLPKELKNAAYSIIGEDDELMSLLRSQVEEVNSPVYRSILDDIASDENTAQTREKIDEIKTGVSKWQQEGFESMPNLWEDYKSSSSIFSFP